MFPTRGPFPVFAAKARRNREVSVAGRGRLVRGSGCWRRGRFWVSEVRRL
jgi:hypothetical protein